MQHCLDSDVTLEVARLFVSDLSFDKQIVAFDWAEEIRAWHGSLRTAIWYLVQNQIIVYENSSFGK